MNGRHTPYHAWLKAIAPTKRFVGAIALITIYVYSGNTMKTTRFIFPVFVFSFILVFLLVGSTNADPFDKSNRKHKRDYISHPSGGYISWREAPHFFNGAPHRRGFRNEKTTAGERYRGIFKRFITDNGYVEGEDVRVLQVLLKDEGCLDKSYAENGIFDETTRTALRNCQKRNGIRQSGEFDKDTTRAFYRIVEKKGLLDSRGNIAQ